MASDQTMELRVTRLENDSESVDGLITGIRSTQREHTHRLDGIVMTVGQIHADVQEVVRHLPEPR